MRAITFLLIASSFFGLTASAATKDDIVLTLRLEERTTLPGIMVPITLIVENRSSQAVNVPTAVLLRVSGPNGEYTGSSPILGDQVASPFRLSAGAVKELYFPPSLVLSGAAFSYDQPGFSFPGQHRIRAVLEDWPEDPTNPTPNEAVSNEVVLTVTEPQGNDALIWERMLELTAGQGWAARDWDLHDGSDATLLKDSSYYPFILIGAMTGSIEGNHEAREEALATGKLPQAWKEEVLLSFGRGLLLEADEAYHLSRNIDLAAEFAARARIPLEKVERESRIPWNRERARKDLAKALTREQYEALDARLRATAHPTPEPVVPFVECVSLDGKRLTARFGYDNPNRGAKQIPAGKDNMITPAPQDRGQTRFFRPGKQQGAVTVTVQGSQVIWHLDGSRATANRDFGVRCDDGGD